MHLAMKFEMIYGDNNQYQLDGEVWGMLEEGSDEVWYQARINYPDELLLDWNGRITIRRSGGEFIAMKDTKVKNKDNRPFSVATRAYQRMMRQRPNRKDVERDMRLWAEKMKMKINEIKDLEAMAA